MIRSIPYFSALLAALLSAFVSNAARADVREFVSAGRISWSGSPVESWLGDGESQLLLKFTGTVPGSCSFTLAPGIRADVRVVVIGGGGAGGVSHGDSIGAGGGGAGGLKDSSLTISGGAEGMTWPVVVGAGGACPTAYTGQVAGADGLPSSFGELVSAAGGGGGGAGTKGRDGACGGGGSKGSANNDGGDGSEGGGGGTGKGTNYGAGGGGMGAVGKGATSLAVGAGGAGVSCDISGASVYYCGGGGGGSVKSSKAGAKGGDGGGGAGGSSDYAESGANGTGSGGGGSGLQADDFGGRGGDGVVFVLVKAAVDLLVEVPSVASVPYSGANVVAFDFGTEYEYRGGVTNATNAGTYSFAVRPAEGRMWKDGSGDVEKTVVWSITPVAVVKPTAPTGLVYAGTNAVAFVPGPGYVYVGGQTNSTDAGSFRYGVRLDNPANVTNYVWLGEEPSAAVAEITNYWSIAVRSVDRPEAVSGLAYTGEEQNGFARLETDCYDVVGPTNAVDAAVNAVSFTLKNAGARNFVWSTDPAEEDRWETTWAIDRATNAITSLEIVGWRIGAEPVQPTCRALWGEDTVGYDYSQDPEAGPWVPSEALTTPGIWYVRAIVPEGANWCAATNLASFSLWDTPSNLFSCSVEIEIPGYGEAREVHQALIRLSPEKVPGFDYADAGPDGRQLAFLDGDGELLRYEVDTWNPEGESLLWLRLDDFPAEGARVKLYWGLLPGMTAPAYDASEVWPNYAGVWHMSEEIAAAAAAVTPSADSSPAKNHGRPYTVSGNIRHMVSTEGVVGNARVNCSGGAVADGNRLATTSYALGGRFTFSGWFRMDRASSYPRLIGNRKTNDDGGWSVELAKDSSTNLIFRYAKKSTELSPVAVDDLTEGWVYLCVVFDGKKVTVYSNGEQAGEPLTLDSAIADVSNILTIGGPGISVEPSLGGAYDEVRLCRGVLSANTVARDYEVMAGNVGNRFGIVTRHGVKINYWVREPSITPSSWNVAEPPAAWAVDLGQPKEGSVTNWYYEVYAPTNVYDDISQLVRVGYYRAVFTLKDPAGYSPLTKVLDVRVLASDPYVDIGGDGGDSGRVLLMNNDKLTVGPVTLTVSYQGYADTSTSRGTYWDIPNAEGEAAQGSKKDLLQSGVSAPADAGCADFNIKIGRSSTLMKKGGFRLWHLEDCRHGNAYVFDPNGSKLKNDYALSPRQNYLPYSGTSYDITSTRSIRANRASSGQIVMRNRLTAAVYSPCYTNGLGTVYLDAVNGSARDRSGTPVDGSGYRIAVQWATNAMTAAGESLPPTDENCSLPVGGSTDWYARLEGQWHDAEMIAYKRDGGDSFGQPERTTELALAAGTGGSDRNFYRIAVPLNFNVPARFRIVRRSVDPEFRTEDLAPGGRETAKNGYDNGGFVLLDNVIVSYPPMWAELLPTVKFSGERSGLQTLGYENATTVPYPAVGERSAYMRGTPVPHINSSKKDIRPDDFIVSAMAHYRWRYLDQRVGDWKTVDLDPKKSFLSMTPLEIPSVPGDIEFWLESHLQAPFYDYVDYSGTGFGIPYTEAVASVTNGLASAVETASRGTDWFFRLREGRSDRQGVKVVVEGALAGEYELSLMEGDVWRGFVPNPTNVTGDCTFRFVGYNLQTPGDTNYAENVTVWGVADGFKVKELPVNGKLDVGGGDISFKVSHLANNYEVRMNEKTLTWSFATAEYQDFNQWTDVTGDRFVGNSAMGNLKGTAPTKKTYLDDFREWAAMTSTNSEWQLFSFTDLNHLEGRTAYRQLASDSDEAWSIGPGMWVARYYADRTSDSEMGGVAYQLKGCGEGYVQYTDRDRAPRGIESISFNARLGQSVDFRDFCYYDADSKSRLTNYLFTARGSFDTNNNRDFSGNASLSLVAYYRENKGCYEARWEQMNGSWSKPAAEGGICTGIGAVGQRLCLYRWYCDQDTGRMECTLLKAWTNLTHKVSSANVPYVAVSTGTATTASDNERSAQPLMISAETTPSGTRVIVAVATAAKFGGDNTTDKPRKWCGCFYNDTDAKRRLTSGTYGLLVSNCPGLFYASTSYRYNSSLVWSEVSSEKGGSYLEKVFTFPSASPRGTSSDFRDEFWVVSPGRMMYDRIDMKDFVRAAPAPQVLNVWTSPAGRADWSLLKTVDVGSAFGTPVEPFTVQVGYADDCSVRITTGGEFDDPRHDVILDSVVIRQFRGGDYADKDEMTRQVPAGGRQRIPGWEDPKNIRGMTNFVFTSAWIDNDDERTAGRVRLSARRTTPEKISGIRSPLLDGYYNRGRGLGMFAFDYTNAQVNARLLVQIATNGVDYTDLPNHDGELAPGLWETVDKIDFSRMSPEERIKGTYCRYFGIHDRAAAVRVIVDPALVTSLRNETDPSRYGDVSVTQAMVRDEPAIGSGCWTGWNLRMFDATYEDGEGRMYLPDWAHALESRGRSAALNNSVTDGVDNPKDQTFRQNVPFVQSPRFGEGIVGEISFKARTWDRDQEQPANIRIYGSKVGGDTDDGWEVIGDVEVTNDIFTSYSYRVDEAKSFTSFRLGVSGVSGVKTPGPVMPEGWDRPVRVLIDEVVVSQAIEARMGFRNVGAFKSDIVGTEIVPNVPSREEQPLAMEAWGVQCELYGAQQPDAIDFEHLPTVKLYWYTGSYPWGYDRWKDLPGAKSAYLRLATDSGVSNWVYRSSQRACPDAVIPMATESPTLVQYMLETVFYTKGSETPKTNWLSRSEWVKPEWFNPLDYNADNPDFAAFTILDNVAPGWAWINEVNLFGEFDENLNNTEGDRQYIEIAQPPEAELLDWEVRLLEPQEGNGMVLTNVLATFGRNGFAAKKDLQYVDPNANMVFRTLANKAARDKGYLKTGDGTLDAVWKVDCPTTTFTADGEISAYYSVAFQLVRSSGVVEHEIVVMGTNWWSDLPLYRDKYHPTNTVNYLDGKLRNADFLYVGKDDDGGQGNSLSVTNGNGSAAEQWTNGAAWTPGRLNEGQWINPDHPMPNGESVIIYATVRGGYVAQRGDDGAYTDQMLMLTVPKGSRLGTNVLYRVDPWFVLGMVTTNSASALGAVTRLNATQPKYYELKVGVGCSNNVTVVAESAPDPDFADKYGIAEDDPYRPAIIDWLHESRTALGEPWENVEAGEIYLADFLTLNGTFKNTLTLKDMYYLDMDPTVTNQALVGGVTEPPREHRMTIGGEPVTNIRYTVYMMFTNRTDDVSDRHYGRHWTPYTLRGLDPGSVSLDYDETVDDWRGPTFKPTGILLNGLTDLTNPENWMPLRWFTFRADSFAPDGTARIEIEDPYWHGSVGYNSGWGAYMQEYGRKTIGYFWSLDTRIRPAMIETLKPENYYDD